MEWWRNNVVEMGGGMEGLGVEEMRVEGRVKG